MTEQDHPALKREVGVAGAAFMGLGSIIGTGVFVSIGVAAGVAGPAVVLAIAIAALVAIFNGLSSAQLAASHPVSGGTYEYGYRYLNPLLGFSAGWMFLAAKSASSATAALGLAGYTLHLFGEPGGNLLVPLALAAVLILTLLVLSGIRWSSRANMVIVSITLLALGLFVLAGLPLAISAGPQNLSPLFRPDAETGRILPGVLEACALMFVAYTGYGRIATLGEEVRDPKVNIPRAVIVALLVSMLLYVSVGTVGVAAVGAETLGAVGREQAAPLEAAASEFPLPGVSFILAIGAVTAMLGVLLNLILGLSRVLLAMGRRRDMPGLFSRLDATGATPYPAVIAVGLAIAGLVLTGDVRVTWSFSAFTVLIYYAITNLAALRLGSEERLYPRAIPAAGLVSCLFLAFWVERQVWLAGLAMLAAGAAWHLAARWVKARRVA